jgi:hypothetical protein
MKKINTFLLHVNNNNVSITKGNKVIAEHYYPQYIVRIDCVNMYTNKIRDSLLNTNGYFYYKITHE